MSDSLSRRRFLGAAAGAAAAGLTVASKPAQARRAANEEFTVAVMGVRGRGRFLAKTFADQPDVSVAYICEVDENVVEPCLGEVEERQGRAPQVVDDFRRALDDPAVDGLVIAAPDHWHALATIHGCQAGKHVFCEKPISHNIAEGQRMIAAARKHNRVVQVGTVRRSSESLKAMVDFLQSGGVGPLHFARTWIVSRRENIGREKDQSAPPAGVNYDMWLGPAPDRAFNANHFHYRWHWFWEYGTGELGNNGIHGLDLARWGLGVEQPQSVVSSGAKHFFDDDQVTPDTQLVCYEYPEATLVWEHRTWSPHNLAGSSFGVEFHGEDGVVTTDGRGWTIQRYREEPQPGSVAATPYEPAHERNWLDCIRDGERPTADVAIGHASTLLCHIGNISQRVNRKLSWDGENERFPDADPDANALLKREYRAPWTLPEV